MSIIGSLFGNPIQGADITAMSQSQLDALKACVGPYPGGSVTATNTVGQYSRELMHGLFPDSVGQTIFDGRLVVTKVLNGYVVQYMHNPNQKPDVYVESDLDGVNDRIKALMTTFRLEKT
jgi:hypothetical protein